MEKYVASLSSNAYARNTRQTYQKVLTRLMNWLNEHQLELNDKNLAVYLAHLYASGLSQSLCALTVAAVSSQLKRSGQSQSSPIGVVSRATMSGILRSPKQGRGQVKGLRWEESNRVAACQANNGTPSGWRNAALISLVSDALLRVSELAALRISDLSFEPDGSARLLVHRSKTDQEGLGKFFYRGTACILCSQMD